MASILVKCPPCQSELVYRHGKARSGLQRYRCRDCQYCFQLKYLYEANKPGVTDKITDMAMNDSGVRDTGRVLGISINHLHCPLKKLAPPTVSPIPFNEVSDKTGIERVCERDMNRGRMLATSHNNVGYGMLGRPISNGYWSMRLGHAPTIR